MSSSVQFESGNTRKIFTGLYLRVENIPELRALISWIPLATLVAKRKHSLLGSRALFIPPCAPPIAASYSPLRSASSRAPVLSAPQQRCVPQANGFAPSFKAARLVCTISFAPIARSVAVAEIDHLPELVARIHVQQRKRNCARDEKPSAPAVITPRSPFPIEYRMTGRAYTRQLLPGRCGCSLLRAVEGVRWSPLPEEYHNLY